MAALLGLVVTIPFQAGAAWGAKSTSQELVVTVRSASGTGWPATADPIRPASTISIMVEDVLDESGSRVEYSVDGGASWHFVSETAHTWDFHRWLVPDVESAKCLLRITLIDRPDEVVVTPQFSVGPRLVGTIEILSPKAGDVVAGGLTFWLDYVPFHSQVGTSELNRTLTLEYSLDGGQTWQVSSGRNGYASRVNMPWQGVPDITADNCYVRLTCSSYPGMVGESGPFSIRPYCPCDEALANMRLIPREGEYLLPYLERTPLIHLETFSEANVWLSMSRSCTSLATSHEFYGVFPAGEHFLDPIDLFGTGVAYSGCRTTVRMEATCREGSPSCRTQTHPIFPPTARWDSPESTVEQLAWVVIHSPTCESGSIVSSPEVEVEILPVRRDAFDEHKDLFYYWGPDTGDEANIRANSISVDSSWRGGSFTASEHGDWLFALWGPTVDSLGGVSAPMEMFRLTYAEIPQSIGVCNPVVSDQEGIRLLLDNGSSVSVDGSVDLYVAESYCVCTDALPIAQVACPDGWLSVAIDGVATEVEFEQLPVMSEGVHVCWQCNAVARISASSLASGTHTLSGEWSCPYTECSKPASTSEVDVSYPCDGFGGELSFTSGVSMYVGMAIQNAPGLFVTLSERAEIELSDVYPDGREVHMYTGWLDAGKTSIHDLLGPPPGTRLGPPAGEGYFTLRSQSENGCTHEHTLAYEIGPLPCELVTAEFKREAIYLVPGTPAASKLTLSHPSTVTIVDISPTGVRTILYEDEAFASGNHEFDRSEWSAPDSPGSWQTEVQVRPLWNEACELVVDYEFTVHEP